MSNGTSPRHVLCRFDELADGGSKGFELGDGATALTLFVVRRGKKVFAYENSCPHTGGPLDWVPDQFMDEDKTHIMCATHGALFRAETGQCLDGPCIGGWLRALPVTIENDEIILNR